MTPKHERAEHANALIQTISEHGRQFFLRVGKLNREWIAPQRLRLSDGDIWGYGDAASQTVRRAAFMLPIFNEQYLLKV